MTKAKSSKSAYKGEVKGPMDTAGETGNDAEVETEETVEAETTKKQEEIPTKMVKLLKGTQFSDRDSGDLYLVGQWTPVKKITNWVRIQAKHGMFEVKE